MCSRMVNRSQPPSSRQKAETHKKLSKKHGGDGKRQPLAPSPFSAPWSCRPPSIETPPHPVPVGPHSMTRKRLMFSNPTPSQPQLFPAAKMSDDMLLAPTPPLQCASTLQPSNLSHVLAFNLKPFLLQFVSTACHRDSISFLLNHGNQIFEPMCVSLPFPLLPLLF